VVSIKNKPEGNGAFARWLLATSSLVAFSAGASTQAHAFPCQVSNSGNAPGISVSNTFVSGNVCNSGTLSPGGIAVTNSTINSSIFDSGTIAGGISVDSNSQVNSGLLSPAAISVNGSGSTFSGGILNSGALSSFETAITVDSLSSFSGGIANGGTINAGVAGTNRGCAFGINVTNVTAFAGGIANGGTINAGSGAAVLSCNASSIGIGVAGSGVETFSGGIGNSGTINATASVSPNQCNNANAYSSGIDVSSVSTFSGGIGNSGTINVAATLAIASSCNCGNPRARAYGINVNNLTAFSGGISNGGTLNVTATASVTQISCNLAVSADAYGIRVTDVSSFSNGITNGGTISATAAASSLNAFCNCGSAIANAFGVNVSNVATFSGGITNNRTILATATATSGGSKIFSCANAYGISIGNNKFGGLSTFSGGVANSGTISARATATATGQCCAVAIANAYGISVAGVSDFSGGISNSGTITAAATANASAFDGAFNCAVASANAYGINVTGIGTEMFAGGIANGGAVLATASATATGFNCACASAQAVAYGIGVTNISSFSGGISNSGTIVASATATASSTGNINDAFANALAIGINVGNVAAFSGGIRNAGTITATATATANNCGGAFAAAYGISVSGDSCGCSAVGTFADGISNKGAITATATATAAGLMCASANAYGISVTNLSAFSGGISNGGSIAATATVAVGGASAYGVSVDNVSTFAGGISNNGTITATANAQSCNNALAYGLSVTRVPVFSGDINNSGTITAVGGRSVGIFIDDVSTFTGRIINSGTITGDTGIVVGPSTPGISIFSSGTITGNCGAAISFLNAGGNTLTLGPGFVMNGNVLATGSDTFQLGGSGNGTFDLSTIGTQYTGFGTFNTISATWTATGTAAASSTVWNVLGGTFLVNGDLSPWAGVAVTGGILGGTGLLPDTTIQSGGTLIPGLPGTPGGLLTIATGNLTMNSGSLYLVNVGNGTTGFTSATNVTNGGAAFLNPGSLIQVAGSGGAYTQGAHYTVLTATGGVTGTFSNPNNIALGHLGSMLAQVSYDANDVFLNLVPASLLSLLPPGASTNVINVANGITTANVGTPPLQFQNLFSLPPQQLAAALTQLSGEVATGSQATGVQLMNSFISLLLNPFASDHGGVGPATPFAAEREMFSPEIATAYASAMPTKAPAMVDAARYNAWGSAYGGANGTAGDPTGLGSHDINTHAAGFAGGADIRTAPGTVVGFSLGGASTSWRLSDSLGTGRSDAFQAGLYGSRQWGPAYLSGALAYANYWAKTDRTVMVAGADRLTASFDAQGLGGRVEGGYRVWAMPVGVTPYAAVQAQYFHTPTYAETAASGSPQFALTYSAKNETVVRTEIGSWFDQTVQLEQANRLGLFARAAWAYDFGNNPSLVTTFLSLPAASFVVNGAKPPVDLALATAGAELRMQNGISIMGRFDGEFGKGSQTYTGTGRIRYQW
jgi:outer membrane autotransporter protein